YGLCCRKALELHDIRRIEGDAAELADRVPHCLGDEDLSPVGELGGITFNAPDVVQLKGFPTTQTVYVVTPGR
ncbi:hypothetical protein C6A85_12555, partial [Mycobacterium sp. ITM-2017-0098]